MMKYDGEKVSIIVPEISIIVPVYKAELYLPKCIESILGQTFTNFELILVDDGSPDNSGMICDSYAKKDNRIKVIHQANSGVSTARNSALDLAVGKYIMFCDSDDWVEPDWCKCLYETMKVPNVVMALCGHKEWKDDTVINIHCFENSKDKMKLSEIFGDPIAGVPWNKIFIREQICKYKLRFPVEISNGEDLRFVFNYLATYSGDKEVILLPQALNNYRNVDGSLSRRYIKDFWELEKEVIKLRIKVAEIHNTDLEKYEETLNYSYYRLFFFAMRNLFNPNNNSSYLQKHKDLKEIVNSTEFENMQKSEMFEKYPAWYQFLLKKRITPILLIYHLWKR